MGIKKHLRSMAQAITETFGRDAVSQTAKKTGFSKRSSKCKPEAFLSLCTLLKDSVGKNSLQHLCSAISYQFQISISKQALHERFNGKAVSFLKQIYGQLAARQEGMASVLERHPLFSRIRIMDATSFRLPSPHADYPGVQGYGVKVQLEYEWLRGEVLYHKVQAEAKSDKDAAREQLDSLEPGDLLLRDLGYYSARLIKEMNKKEAYFISRVPSQTKFWTWSGEKGWIQIKPEEDLKNKVSGETIDYGFIKVGGDSRSSFVARIVAQKLTLQQRQRRERALHLKRQKGHQTLSANQRNQIQILVTNVTQEELGAQDLYPLYSIRWQVEILFKTWKSLFKVDDIRKMNQERVECHLYGTLIEILLSSMMTFQCRYYLYWKHQIEASEYKCMDLVKRALPHLASSIQSGPKSVLIILEMIFENTRRHGRKEHRKKHESPFDILGLAYN
ncbi:IS4 family transposase [Halobacillus sp. K22]|uniref:IS4 family transposase n=1 Tax=Halobacillus sp. K22 TaxID=3457431 RepID=UPI003FCD8BB0